MSTIVQDLNTLQDARDNMKTALENKGMTVTNDIRTYANAIANIPSGSGSGDVKLFDTVEHMQADPNPSEGDLAVVYREEITAVTEESEFDSCTFPNTVVLDEAFTGDIYASFRAVDRSVMFDGMVEMSSSRFRFNGYGESAEIRIEYESQDGITYTRTDGGDALQEFGVIIKWEDYGEGFNSVIGNFMKIGENYFDGLYIYNYIKEISQIPLLSINGNNYNDDEYTGELNYLSKDLTSSVYDAISTLETLENIDKSSYVILFFNDTLTEFKIYLSQITSSDKYMGTLYSIIKDGYVCASPYGGYRHSEPFIVKCFTYNLVDKTYTYDDITATSNPDYKIDETAWYIPHTNEAYISGNIKLSQFSAGDDSSLYIVQADNTSGYTFYFDKYVKYKLKYITVSSQLDSTSNYVYEKTFYGKNGVETGNLATNVSNSFADIEAELYYKIHQKYEDMPARVLDDTSIKFISNNIYGIPVKKNGIPLLDTSNVTNMSTVFFGCKNLKEIPLLDTANVTNMDRTFTSCFNLVTVAPINTSKVTNMYGMFSGCINLVTIHNLDTSNVTSMYETFRSCSNLKDLPTLNTGLVTTMNNTFRNCSNLETINLTDTHNVVNMDSIFSGCSKLKSIATLNTCNIINMTTMFDNCTNLVDIPVLNTVNTKKIYYSFRNCPNLSNDSLNNILRMCASATKVTTKSYKSLTFIGLSQEQANICKTLSNYSAFTSAGWTTGY